MTQSNGNGQGDYKPSAEYRYLGADVWGKREGDSLDEDVAYTEELLEELEDEEQSDSNSDNN
jgi:hypothetical protein